MTILLPPKLSIICKIIFYDILYHCNVKRVMKINLKEFDLVIKRYILYHLKNCMTDALPTHLKFLLEKK
jgi:hypothetical protein